MEDPEVVADVEAALDELAMAYRERMGLIHPQTLASVFGLNVDTLKQWRVADRGPSYVRIGKRVWYLFDDVVEWVQKERVMTTQRRDYSKMTQATQEPADHPGQGVDTAQSGGKPGRPGQTEDPVPGYDQPGQDDQPGSDKPGQGVPGSGQPDKPGTNEPGIDNEDQPKGGEPPEAA